LENYKVTIRPRSSFITPLDSDTLFGSLCWIIRWKHGENKLEEFLDKYNNEPPFLISSGLQANCLPFPVTQGISRSRLREIVKESYGDINPKTMNTVIRQIKKIKKEKYIPIDVFKDHINNFSLENLLLSILGDNIDSMEENYKKMFSHKKPFFTVKDRYHNMINRISNSSTDGELFTQREITYHDDIDIYLKLPKDDLFFWQNIFEALSYEGYGSKKSTGKGQFSIFDFKRVTLPKADNPSHFMTLSSFIPSDDIPKGNYKIKTKRGKLGSSFSQKKYSPWKKPVIFYEKGSTFELNAMTDNNNHGSLVNNIHHSLDNVVQYAYGFALEVKLDE